MSDVSLHTKLYTVPAEWAWIHTGPPLIARLPQLNVKKIKIYFSCFIICSQQEAVEE